MHGAANLDSFSRDSLSVCLGNENPYRLVSLLDMLPFPAHDFCKSSSILGQAFAYVKVGTRPTDESWSAVARELGMLERASEPLGSTNTRAQISRAKPIF